MFSILSEITLISTWQSDELHLVGLETFFDDGFACCIDEFDFLLLFDETNLVFHGEGEIGPKDMVDVQIHFFLLSFHF